MASGPQVVGLTRLARVVVMAAAKGVVADAVICNIWCYIVGLPKKIQLFYECVAIGEDFSVSNDLKKLNALK